MAITIWIISLDPQSQSSRQLSEQLHSQGLAHEFVEAVDGRRSRPALQGREVYSNRKSWLLRRRLLTNSELGCYLAHYRAICRAYEQGIERLCILEDDVCLEPAFADVLAAIEAQCHWAELIRLMGLRRRKRKPLFDLVEEKYQLVRPVRGWCGAQGYVLNRAGMEKVIDYGREIYKPIDIVFDHFWDFDLQVFGVEPHVLYERESPSSVAKVKGERQAPWYAKVMRPWFNLYLSAVRRFYLLRKRTQFFPASSPGQQLGRTKRIR